MEKIEIFNHYKELRPLGISFFELCRLKFKKGVLDTKLFKKKLFINSAFWYVHGLKEIFIDEVYKFRATNLKPYIIDCGSNIGLSILYFKQLYPESRITAFEPDKEIAAVLKENIKTFNLKNVEIRSEAVWDATGNLFFDAAGGVGGRISQEEKSNLSVKSIRLHDLLSEKVDFLKIDIEGAEYEVIIDCAEKLVNVNNIFIEYHSLPSKEQHLDKILEILKNAGFKYYLKEAWVNQKNPYINERKNLYDLQLNIFGYRI